MVKYNLEFSSIQGWARHLYQIICVTISSSEYLKKSFDAYPSEATMRILLGTLYPAYASYKAVKTKNVKEYVKWMMYWIVFALFTCIETFADIFISWLPFYYEIKVVFVIWLLSPATKGASILYRKFIHPQLSKREQDIDNYIAKASDQSYTTLLTLGRHGLNYATNIVITTALKGQSTIAEHVKKSYSLNDLSNDEQQKFISAPLDEVDYDEDELDNRMIQEQYEEEMAEKDLHETSGDRALPARRRTTKAKEAELYPLPESDEANVRDVKITRSRRAYVHKEAYHYGTLPRKTKYNRPPINTSTPAGSDS